MLVIVRMLPLLAAPAMVVSSSAVTAATTLQWTDAAAFVKNSGLNASVAKQSPYARLPLAAKSGAWCSPSTCPVRAAVWAEGQNGAGLYVGFRSDAEDLWLNATLLEAPKESTVCSAVCGSGLDLYAFDETSNAWRWVDTTKNSDGGGWAFSSASISRSMFKNNARGGPHVGSGKFTRYRFHLPIYNGLTKMAIGVNLGAKVIADPADAPLQKAPVLWYGTSITNGHVASRPGMIFTNVLSRMLGRDVINLGFGGNGKMETAVGAVIAQVKQAAVIVIDCNWNMGPGEITTNAPLIVQQLREEWSATKPIVLAEGTSAGDAWISPSASREAHRAALLAVYAALSKTDKALHYVKGNLLFGESGMVDLPTAQGTHPDDLGHHMIAQFYAKFLPPILAGAAPAPLPAAGAAAAAATPPSASTSAEVERTDANVRELHHNASKPMPGCHSSLGDVQWTDAKTLGVGGRADWGGLPRENWWDRFPLSAKADVTSGGGGKGIWGLSKCTPSEFVGFTVSGGSASALFVRYDIDDPSGVNPSGGKLSIMPPLGRNGVDLYGQVKKNGAWVWAGNAAGSGSESTVCSSLSRRTPPLNTDVASRFMLYLPLWRACDNLTIGIPQADYDKGVRLVKEKRGIDRSKKPVVWYGTSILHGAASTRSGQAFSNRVQRGLNRTVLNFGFSGSGHMDIGIAKWLAKIDAAVYIIDCSWNMQVTEIARKTAPIVNYLRAQRPGTPIVLADGTPDGAAWFFSASAALQANKTAALKSGFDACIKNGTKELYMVDGASLFGEHGDKLVNPTVGGCHPNDLGTADVASFWTKFLPTVMKDYAL